MAVALAGPDPSGIGSADLVVEEFSSPVRYVAVFQSKQAQAGPVTSTQPSDRVLLSVMHPLFGYDGAAEPYFITGLNKSKVKDAGYAGHPSLYATGPQGLTASTAAISRGVSDGTAPPPVLRYRGASSGADTLASANQSRPSSARITIPGNGIQVWTFNQHRNRWELTGSGPRVEVANVVVQTVSYKEIGLNSRSRITTLVPDVIGTGRAEVLSGSAGSGGGTAAAGTWSKPHIGEVTNYLDASGSPMALQPGPTWIILAPPGTQVGLSG